jgi:hypothetical protein
MDEMKPTGEIDDRLREVAKLRDGLLRTAPTLSPECRAVLTRFLAEELPVETVLREAATKRDHLLNPRPPKIPGLVESALHRQLLAAEATRDEGPGWRALDSRVSGWAWLRIFRSQLGAILMASVVITAAILFFGGWGAPPRRPGATNLPQASGVSFESALTLDRAPTSRAELFSRRITIASFSLQTNEPASLEASLASSRRIQFAESIETPLGLRLDLPLRATLMEDGLARTP